MKVESTFTFIVSRNLGHPLTWNVSAWRIYLGAALGGVALLGMLVMSVLFLVSVPRLDSLEQERESLQQERDALQDQLREANEAALEGKIRSWIAGRTTGDDAPSLRGDFSDDGEEFYLPPVRLDSFAAQRSRRALEAQFRIVRQGRPEAHRGGFIFAIFEDQTTSPPRYAASPHVEVNEDGFPQFYKGGIRFSRIRNAQTYRRRIRLGPDDGRFTHVTVYLFSLRGGLMAKERYTLDPALFTASI